MNRAILFAPLLSLALVACGERDATADNTTADANVTDSAGGVTTGAAVAAPEFVTTAALSDMYEIESSKLALQKARSDAVKTFARQMIADHTATTAKLKGLLPTAGLTVTPPTALDERRAGLIADLQKATPEDFDTLYLDQQTQAHSEALTLMQNYATAGDNAALKGFAGETAPKIEMHYQMVQKLDNNGADDAVGNVTENTSG
jgi:putative membrane protein